MNFKKGCNYYNINIIGETAIVDIVTAAEFPKLFRKIMQGIYSPQQIFNDVETSLFW